MRTLVEAMPLRDRLAWRAEFRPEHCNTEELLAAIVGGKSQMEIALGMVTRFGTLKALVVATTEEIMSVQGAGPATAARLRAAHELGRRLGTEVDQDAPVVGSPDDAAALLIPRMQHLEQEHLVVLILDTRNRLISEPAEIYRGSLNQTMVRVGELLRPAIRANGASIIVAHNHPSGDPTPSPRRTAGSSRCSTMSSSLRPRLSAGCRFAAGRFAALRCAARNPRSVWLIPGARRA